MEMNFLAGPVIGAVIGYFTNYLAVKMLFRPRQEIRVLGHRLPFTPGVIPKGKERLARAVGEVVGTTLLTKEDIVEKLQEAEIEKKAAAKVIEILSGEIKGQLVTAIKSEDIYERQKEKLLMLISARIEEAIASVSVGELIAEEGGRAIKEKVRGSFLGMMVSDDLISSLTAPMGEKIQQYIEENGMSYIRPILKEELHKLEQSTGLELLGKMEIDEDMVEAAAVSVCHNFIENAADKLFSQFDIAGIIEDKINAMDMVQLEQLVLSVMKKELDSIVGLGAVIGFLIGMVNIFI